MQLEIECPNLQDYLACTAAIDYDHPLIRQKSLELSGNIQDEIAKARTIYEYVRDALAHSGDIQATEVPCTASEVLKIGHGICCAKSHLLAALLRAVGIPTGFCYQFLREDENRPDSDLIVHGLNAVYLSSFDLWIRLDARGNKPGVTAEFSIEHEHLAWPVRPEFEEWDDPVVYAQPWPEVVNLLQSCRTRAELWTYWPTMSGMRMSQ
jgi:transglutaminase-like putative cysteine protease